MSFNICLCYWSDNVITDERVYHVNYTCSRWTYNRSTWSIKGVNSSTNITDEDKLLKLDCKYAVERFHNMFDDKCSPTRLLLEHVHMLLTRTSTKVNPTDSYDLFAVTWQDYYVSTSHDRCILLFLGDDLYNTFLLNMDNESHKTEETRSYCIVAWSCLYTERSIDKDIQLKLKCSSCITVYDMCV